MQPNAMKKIPLTSLDDIFTLIQGQCSTIFVSNIALREKPIISKSYVAFFTGLPIQLFALSA